MGSGLITCRATRPDRRLGNLPEMWRSGAAREGAEIPEGPEGGSPIPPAGRGHLGGQGPPPGTGGDARLH